MQGPAPICMKCKHYHFMDHMKFSCDAFPDRIPEALFKGDKHSKPLPGQNNNIIFEIHPFQFFKRWPNNN